LELKGLNRHHLLISSTTVSLQSMFLTNDISSRVEDLKTWGKVNSSLIGQHKLYSPAMA